jgi:hypothetical protein
MKGLLAILGTGILWVLCFLQGATLGLYPTAIAAMLIYLVINSEGEK